MVSGAIVRVEWGMTAPLSNREPSPLLTVALSSMRNALQLLDDAEAPGDIGAHLDLAIVRLEEVIGPTVFETRQSKSIADPRFI